MIVYRVENNKGCGPFFEVWNIVDKSIYDELYKYSRYLTTLPCPTKAMAQGKHFACRSLEELSKWFMCDEHCDLLTSNGFHISIYNVKTVLRGQMQISFVKKNAKLVDTLPLTSLQGLLQ
jgi:hypothetical protein